MTMTATSGESATVSDTVDLRVPADPAYLAVLRTATAGLAARLDQALAKGGPLGVVRRQRGEPSQHVVDLGGVAPRRGVLLGVEHVWLRGRRALVGRGAACCHYVLRPPTWVNLIHEPWSPTPVST